MERVSHVPATDGVRLALTELGQGSGPGILLVHGFAQNRRTFTFGRLPDGLLAGGARVFTGELRGHGGSERPAAPWDLADHFEKDLPALLAEVADRTGGPVHYQGHSMGGMLGYLLLGRHPLASLTTYCAPMVLGATRPAVRAAAVFAGPLAGAMRRVPMDRFLRGVSGALTKDRARLPLRAVQRFTNLVNPSLGEPADMRAILAGADPESPAVAKTLAAMAVRRRPVLLGIDIVESLHAAELPVCVVVGTRDVFAPPESVAPIRRKWQAGPRRLIVIPDGSHVDVPVGRHAYRLGQDVWRFVASS